MSSTKKGALALYAVLAVLAIAMPASAIGVWSLRILFLLAVVHAIEVLVFFKLCRDAPGSLPMHLLHVFLFGIVHANEIKQENS